jgi:PhnB protein
MKSIIPSISVENCKEAIEYYKNIFGGEIKMVKVADDSEMFKGHEGKIMHSELHISENCVMYFTDIFRDIAQNSNVQLVLEMDSQSQIEQVYSELSKVGKVSFELQKTFWGAFHAVLLDKYGVSWGLNYTPKE